jgi:hypothetical protein
MVGPGHAAALHLPDGMTVKVPVGAVTGSGTLSASLTTAPARAPTGMQLAGPVYDLRLNGSRLTGRVQLAVPVPRSRQSGLSAGPKAALLVYYDASAHRWQPVNARYDPVTRMLTATSTHLSTWSVLGVDAAKITAQLQSFLAGFFGVAGTSQPACPNSAQLTALRVRVASDSGDLVKWCADVSGSGALIRVANNRGYAVEADYPSTWSARRVGSLDSLTGAILDVLPALSLKVGGPNVRTIIIPGGQQIDVTPRPASSGYLLLTPSVEGIVIDALEYAASTLEMTYDDIPGAAPASPSKTAEVIRSVFDNADCLAKMNGVIQGPDVSTAEAAGGIFSSFAHIALGCMADPWFKVYDNPGLYLASFYASFFLWVADSLNIVFQDLRALIDSAVYWQGYHIYVRASSAPHPSATPSPSSVPTPVGPSSPPPVTETVTVSSTSGPQVTSVYLSGGETFNVSYVSGSWTVDYRNFPYVGPGGYSDEEDAKIYQDCKASTAYNYGVLLADVGETPNGMFAIGNGGTFTAVAPSRYVKGYPNGGYLYLFINDTCLTDNAGSVTMKITVP